MTIPQSYPRELAETLTALHGQPTVPISDGAPAILADIIDRVKVLPYGRDADGRLTGNTPERDTEVYIEFDRAALTRMAVYWNGAPFIALADLLPYLYPATARVDFQGDLIITVTDADSAMLPPSL